MKKTKLWMLAAILVICGATVLTSCSKDDDDKDSMDNRLNFATALTQNGTSGTWEGYDKRQFKELGHWVDKSQSYVVIRFDRTSTNATNGTGFLLTFENSYKDTYKEQSEFTWTFDDDMLHITYRHVGWTPVYAEYRTNELVISGDNFTGYWFEQTDSRYKFSYTKSSFKDWDKYKE